MAEEPSAPKEAEPAERSTWAEWINPARWLAFAQRLFRAEKELLEAKRRHAELSKRIRELERTVDRQSGQLSQLESFIEAKVALEVQKALDARARGRRE